MSKIVEVKVYKFNELSPEIQAKVIDRFRDEEYYDRLIQINVDYKKTIEQFEKITDIKVNYYVDPDEYNFDFSLTTRELFSVAFNFSGRPSRMKAWLYNNIIEPFEMKQVYRIGEISGRHVTRQSKIMPARDYNVVFENLDITGTYSDYSLLQAIKRVYGLPKMPAPTVGKHIYVILKDFFKQWSDDLKWIVSDEAIKETLNGLTDNWYAENGDDFRY